MWKAISVVKMVRVGKEVIRTSKSVCEHANERESLEITTRYDTYKQYWGEA